MAAWYAFEGQILRVLLSWFHSELTLRSRGPGTETFSSYVDINMTQALWSSNDIRWNIDILNRIWRNFFCHSLELCFLTSSFRHKCSSFVYKMLNDDFQYSLVQRTIMQIVFCKQEKYRKLINTCHFANTVMLHFWTTLYIVLYSKAIWRSKGEKSATSVCVFHVFSFTNNASIRKSRRFLFDAPIKWKCHYFFIECFFIKKYVLSAFWLSPIEISNMFSLGWSERSSEVPRLEKFEGDEVDGPGRRFIDAVWTPLHLDLEYSPTPNRCNI